MKDYLFAYGTLISGSENSRIDHSIKVNCIDLGPAHIRAKLYDLGYFPGAIPSPSPQHLVHGRLLRIAEPKTTFALLDQYEAYIPNQPNKSEFVRSQTTVYTDNTTKQLTAWVYWYNHKPPYFATAIESGDYEKYLLSKKN